VAAAEGLVEVGEGFRRAEGERRARGIEQDRRVVGQVLGGATPLEGGRGVQRRSCPGR